MILWTVVAVKICCRKDIKTMKKRKLLAIAILAGISVTSQGLFIYSFADLMTVRNYLQVNIDPQNPLPAFYPILISCF
jgi:hypothetical protein